MADVTVNALLGLSKTLDDVVATAIPAHDPLALQELKLVVRYLDFARVRVEHLHARARYELRHYLGLLEEIGRILAATPPAGLDQLAKRARAGLDSPETSISTLKDLAGEIASRITRLLQDSPDPALLGEVERAVVRAGRELAGFDRSWYAPLKLERFPNELKPLDSYIPL